MHLFEVQIYKICNNLSDQQFQKKIEFEKYYNIRSGKKHSLTCYFIFGYFIQSLASHINLIESESLKMIFSEGQEHMEPQDVRQKRKSLRLLRQVFESQNNQDGINKISKKKTDLQLLISAMKVRRLKSAFYQKLSSNNIFQDAISFELLSQEQKNSKRLIKLRGIEIHPIMLSLVFVFEMIFLLITFLISSWMAFIPEFVDSQTYDSPAVVILNIMAFIISCVKFTIVALSQKVQNGVLVAYITDIIVGYARSLMLFADLVFIVILGVILIGRQNYMEHIELYSGVLFVCSIVRIIFSNQNLTLFRTTFMTSSRMDQYYKLVHLIIFNFIFAHFIASMFLAMATLDKTNNWMTNKNLQNQSWYVQYFWSYYWATTTMMTVGFGDFTPVTYEESLIVTFLEFFSCIVLAYNIAEIGAIISTIRASQNQFITKIALFKRMAHQNNIDNQLKNKIESYLREEKTIMEKYELNEQNKLIKSLPKPLRKQYVMQSNGRFFQELPFFKNLQKLTLLKFAQTLSSKVYYPSELLSQANQYNEQIMILKDGKIGLAFRRMDSTLNGIIVQKIEIVERPFFVNKDKNTDVNLPILLTKQFLTPGKMANYDVIALNYSNVSLLSHESFLSIMKESDIDSEYYFSITHQHLSNGNQWKQFPCEICMGKKKNPKYDKVQDGQSCENEDDLQRRYFHTKFDCPRLHYFPHHGVIIYKHLAVIDQPQQRQVVYRRKQHKNYESCLSLRKPAFKQYEQLIMMSEKKIRQQFSKQTALPHSMPKPSTTENQLQRYQPRKYFSYRYLTQTPRNKLNFDHSKKSASNNNLQHPRQNKIDDQLEMSSSLLDTISMEEIEFQTFSKDQIAQTNPFQNVNQDFWYIEMDVMANYLHYYSHQNASKLDAIELCKNKANKARNPCVIEGIKGTKGQQSIETGKNKLSVGFPLIKVISQHESEASEEQNTNNSLAMNKKFQDTKTQEYFHYSPNNHQNTTLCAQTTRRQNARFECSADYINDETNKMAKFRNETLTTQMSARQNQNLQERLLGKQAQFNKTPNSNHLDDSLLRFLASAKNVQK